MGLGCATPLPPAADPGRGTDDPGLGTAEPGLGTADDGLEGAGTADAGAAGCGGAVEDGRGVLADFGRGVAERGTGAAVGIGAWIVGGTVAEAGVPGMGSPAAAACAWSFASFFCAFYNNDGNQPPR